MLRFEDYFDPNNQGGEQRPWRQIPNKEGLYVLANPFMLDNQLYEELSKNLNPTADYNYKSQNGWSYRVKVNYEGKLSIIGWKARQSSSSAGGGGGGGGKPYQGKSSYTPPKEYVDVEVKHTENVSTVNEILSNGYMQGEMWRLQGVIEMTELEQDGTIAKVPHFVLVRKKEFVQQPKTIAVAATAQPQQVQQQGEMPQ